MAQLYGIIATHEPATCPQANPKVREAVGADFPRLGEVLTQHAVSMLSAEHFDPEHLFVFRVEADSIEAVRDFVNTARLPQWNNCRIYPLTPLPELVEHLASLPPPIL